MNNIHYYNNSTGPIPIHACIYIRKYIRYMRNGVEKSMLNYGKAGATPPPTGIAGGVGTALFSPLNLSIITTM